MIAAYSPRYEDLQPHLSSRQKIRIERRRPANPHLNGYLVGLSPRLGMMHCFDDFQPDGYTIFYLDDIEDIRSNEYERHWDHMLAAEGLLQGLDTVPNVNLRSMATALTSSTQAVDMLVVECEDFDRDIQDFYIGKLVSVEGKVVEFDNFDALGSWDAKTHRIELTEITLVQLETDYLKRFSRYVTGKPASQRDTASQSKQ